METIRASSPIRRWVLFESPARNDFGDVSRLHLSLTERSAVQRTVTEKSPIYAKEIQ